MKKMNMRKRLIISLISLAVLPVIISMSSALQNQIDTAEEQVIASNISRVQWGAQYLEEMVEQLDKLFYSLQINERLLDDLAELGNGTPTEEMIKHQNISEVLSLSYYANSKKIDALMLLDLASLTTFTVHHNTAGDLNRLDGLDQYWKRLKSSDTNIYFEEANALYAVHSFNDFTTREPYGGVAVKINPLVWETLFEILEPDLKGDVYVFNDNLQLMQGSSLDQSAEYIIDLIQDDSLYDYKEGKLIKTDDHYLFIHEVDEAKLIIVKSVAVTEVFKNSFNTLVTGIVVLIIFTGVSVVIALILSHRISQPIVALAQTMKKAEIGGLGVKKSEITDEVELLEQGYNEMLMRLKELIKEEYQHEIDLKNAQLLALQTQINPHFLNNSLNLIGGMALESGNQDIYHLTKSIGQQLRYSLKTSKVLVSLNDEVDNIKNYLMIQETRFQDRCVIDLDIPEILLGVQVPKMILQPIVENAFEHGLQPKRGHWQVTIRVRIVRNKLLIAVKDNGIGITPDQLKIIRLSIHQNEGQEKKGVGLINVHSRLRLRFGPPSGLKIFSKMNQGTLMVLTLNIKEQVNV